MADCPGQVEIQFGHVNLACPWDKHFFNYIKKYGNYRKLGSNYSRIHSVTTQIIPKQKIQVDNGSVTRKKYSRRC